MRVVIFGGRGFVGRNAVLSLRRKNVEVVVCDLPYFDIRTYAQFERFRFHADDVVVNLAAKQYGYKHGSFHDTNTVGTLNIITAMAACGCSRLIYFSSDMAISPIGYYGQSKRTAEFMVGVARRKISSTIFRPRLIIGPGRVGILGKLFWLVKHNLPVPMIGDGSKPYQMVSVFDCVQAIERAIERGCPNGEYNLGSLNPPPVKQLLEHFIKDAGSKSVVVPTNASMVKGTLNLLSRAGLSPIHREQYEMVDNQPEFDISLTEKGLGWKPEYSDQEMLLEAYREWRSR